MSRSVVAMFLWAALAPAAKLDTAFEGAPVRHQMQQAFAGMIRAAIADPKGEYAGFLAKTGFVVAQERGQPRLMVVENPDAPFLRRMAALYDDPQAAEKMLRLLREQEPERTSKLASYTIQRVLERLERDRQDHKLSESARRAIARAVIEEMVATASIDSANKITGTVQSRVAERRVTRWNLLGYGFSLIEHESPGPAEWQALRRDSRLFCVRFSPRGFIVYRAENRQRQLRSYSTDDWRRETQTLLAEFTARHNSAGKSWMGMTNE